MGAERIAHPPTRAEHQFERGSRRLGLSRVSSAERPIDSGLRGIDDPPRTHRARSGVTGSAPWQAYHPACVERALPSSSGPQRGCGTAHDPTTSGGCDQEQLTSLLVWLPVLFALFAPINGSGATASAELRSPRSVPPCSSGSPRSSPHARHGAIGSRRTPTPPTPRPRPRVRDPHDRRLHRHADRGTRLPHGSPPIGSQASTAALTRLSRDDAPAHRLALSPPTGRLEPSE